MTGSYEKMKAKKQRLDIELTERRLSPSREKAKAFIMAGEVFVNSQVEIKPDRKVFLTAKKVIFINLSFL